MLYDPHGTMKPERAACRYLFGLFHFMHRASQPMPLTPGFKNESSIKKATSMLEEGLK